MRYWKTFVLLLVGIAIFLVAEKAIGKKFGFPLDDSFIHLQFAKNIANGEFFEYNIGEKSTGATSPLWVMLIGFVISLGINGILAAKILGIIFVLLTFLISFKLLKILASKWGLDKSYIFWCLTYLALDFHMAFSSLSGMEPALATFLLILSVYLILVSKPILASIAIALAINTRPELYLALPFLLLYPFVGIDDEGARLKIDTKIIIATLIILVITLPYHIYCYKLLGIPFPATWAAKSIQWPIHPSKITELLMTKVFSNLITTGLYMIIGLPILILIGFIITTVKSLRKMITGQGLNLLLLIVWSVILGICFTHKRPTQFSRYYIPVIPFLIFTGVLGIWQIWHKAIITLELFGKKVSMTVRNSVLYLSVFNAIAILLAGAILYGLAVKNINEQQRKAAIWIRDNISKNEVIGINDAGAIAYFSEHRVIDLLGLVSPEVSKLFVEIRKGTFSKNNLDNAYISILKKHNIKYLAIYESWFTGILPKLEYETLFSATVHPNIICGTPTIKVLKIKSEKKEFIPTKNQFKGNKAKQ